MSASERGASPLQLKRVTSPVHESTGTPSSVHDPARVDDDVAGAEGRLAARPRRRPPRCDPGAWIPLQ